ncbi:sigma-70 family RNA polymerase sigma factor [bacterium]|nr:sigma-70 family RNA polymerase sigma factor [bacterium]
MAEASEHDTDADLLARFTAGRATPAGPPGAAAEAAFRELVARHGSMVLGVCRRVLGDAHAAEDAFQAAFLVLARRAEVVPRAAAVAWLYGVAYRVALKARAADHRRAARERRAAGRRPEVVDVPPEPDDLKPVIDEELSRLPEKLRAAVLLCDVEGMSRRQAAERLGCPESTLSSRLQLAHATLARRLAGRVVAYSAVGLAVAVPVALAEKAVAAGIAPAAAAAPPAVAVLADSAIRAMVWGPKLWAAVAALLALGLAGGAAVVLTGPAPPPTAGLTPPFAIRDDFDGRLRLPWRPIRPDPSHASLTKHPGALTLTTQEGTMYEGYGQTRPKNLYLIANPVAAGGDFVVTVRLVGFAPVAAYHQAGLVLYDDDDNYLKFVHEWAWFRGGGTCLAAVVEEAGKAIGRHPDPPDGGDSLWLRVIKRGGWYEIASSRDGEQFTSHGEMGWRSGGPRWLGLVAKNGGSGEAPEIDARFGFFELRSP